MDNTCKAYVAALSEVHNNILKDMRRIKVIFFIYLTVKDVTRNVFQESKIGITEEAMDYLVQAIKRSSALTENLNELQQLREFLTGN